MPAVTIPRSIGAAERKLGELGELATATEWHRAAIVAAFVNLPGRGGDRRSGRRDQSAEPSFELAEDFAARGIHGLRSANTVRLYATAWLERFDRPTPGARVELPTEPWPPADARTGTTTNARTTIHNLGEHVADLVERHGAEAVAEQLPAAAVAPAVARPEVADAVVRDERAHRETIRAENRVRPPAAEPRPPSGGGVAGAVAQTVMRIGALAFAQDAQTLLDNLTERRHQDMPWRPGELEALTEKVSEGIRIGQDALALLTPVPETVPSDWS